MNKLNKPKAFEASPKSIMVQFGPEQRECTNLTRSAIMVQTIILVADGGKWHEIEIADLGLDSVHLPSFKNHIETNGLTLSDLGIAPEVPDYSLKHDDFADLEKEFPKHNYIDISRLNDFEKTQGGYSGKFSLRLTLRAIDQRNISIDEWLQSCTSVKYSDVVNTDNPQQAIVVETVQDPEIQPVPSDSISLTLLENITPEKITELQGLRIAQEKIVAENPVIIIKDKKTYAEAKKTAAVLLSASTAIDGTKGMEATISKYLNTIKTTVKNALNPIAKLTRDPYDKQKKLIEDWDNRLLLMVQNRSKELNSVPFVYNSENDTYTIGSLVVSQKEIEELSDIDWSKKIEQGKAIVIALESAKIEQNKEIEALKEANRLLMEKLDLLLKATNPESTITHHDDGSVLMKIIPDTDGIKSIVFSAKPVFGNSAVQVRSKFEPTTEESNKHVLGSEITTDTQNSFRAEQSFSNDIELPNPNNKLLNQLYLDHVSVVEEKQFQECAGYYAQALSDAGEAINDILVNPDKTIQKSVAITELIKTWKL